jgi:fumarate reductase flavoprotein subunit
MSDQKRLNRRDFLKGAAISGAGIAAVGALGATPLAAQAVNPVPTPQYGRPGIDDVPVTSTPVPAPCAAPIASYLPASWDYEADLIVLGGGAAGLAVANEAADAGAKVILLEKTDSCLGSSGRCMGNVSGAGTAAQAARGIKDSPDQYYADMVKGSDGRMALWVARLVADRSAETIDWLIKMGMTFNEHSLDLARPGHSVPRSLTAKPDATQYTAIPEKAARAKGVQILLNTRAVELIQDSNTKEVLGVKAQDLTANKALTFKAKKAVALCTGDISAGKDMKAKYAPSGPAVDIPGPGGPGNTGDGLIMAQQLGADAVCMESGISLSNMPGIQLGHLNRSPDIGVVRAGAIWVNRDGNRYTNEMGATVGLDTLKQADKVAFMVFDDQVAKQDLVFYFGAPRFFADWQQYGAITQAGTIEELAGKLGVTTANLKATVDKYNGYADAKSDSEFKRTELGSGIKAGPFYGIGPCLVLGPTTANGTLMVKEQTFQVLDMFGRVIPRLYAAGDMGKSGSVALGGTHMCIAFLAGRIVGKNAAAEASWA